MLLPSVAPSGSRAPSDGRCENIASRPITAAPCSYRPATASKSLPHPSNIHSAIIKAVCARNAFTTTFNSRRTGVMAAKCSLGSAATAASSSACAILSNVSTAVPNWCDNGRTRAPGAASSGASDVSGSAGWSTLRLSIEPSTLMSVHIEFGSHNTVTTDLRKADSVDDCLGRHRHSLLPHQRLLPRPSARDSRTHSLHHWKQRHRCQSVRPRHRCIDGGPSLLLGCPPCLVQKRGD